MKVLQTLRAILREIFDESAYERFCKREGLTQGRESCALFMKGHRVKVKCC